MHPLVRGLIALVLIVPAGIVLAPGTGGQDAPLCETVQDSDLALTSVSLNTSDPEPGEDVLFIATISNEGPGDNENFQYNFSRNGEKFGQTGTHTDCLTAGSEVEVEASMAWQAETGIHNISAEINHTDNTNPDNDQDSTDVEIGSDLAVTGFEVDPKSTVAGNNVTMTATVENLAERDVTGSFSVQFPVDGNPNAIPSVTVDGLNAGASKTASQSWPLSEGEREVSVVVDGGQQVEDYDRSNNEAGSKTVDVRPARPDLVVAGLDFAPDPPAPGERMQFTPTIRNNGAADSPGPRVSLVVGNRTVDTTTADPVDPGAKVNATLNWQAVEGSHQLRVIVDPRDNITETNENNNEFLEQLAVGADLTVDALDLQPSDPRAGDRVRFTATIGNDGLDIDGGFDVGFEIDGQALGTSRISGLPSGETRNATSSTWKAEVGDHNVSVVVDPDDVVGEIDDTNNDRQFSFTVGEPQPDLAVASAGLSPTTPDAGEDATVKVQVTNAGARGSEGFDLAAEVDGESVGEVSLDGLDPGARTTVDVGEWTAENGSHALVVEVDTGDAVEESNEANNTFRRQFSIGADLAAVNLSLSPPSPEPGDNATALLLVRNNGTVRTGQTEAVFTLDGTELGRANLSQLDPNQEVGAELSFTATRSGTLQARVDPTGGIDEVDEDNNAAEVSLDLPRPASPPDLTILSLDAEADPADADEVQFTAEVANVGEGPAGSGLVVFRVDGSTLGAPADLPSLAAGESANVTSDAWEPTGGSHEIEATVDPDNAIPESDDTNNTLTRSVDGGPKGVPVPVWVPISAPIAAALAVRAVHRTETQHS